MYTLSKIANKEAGTVNELNEKDFAKYQAIVEEYNHKHLENKQKVKPTRL